MLMFSETVVTILKMHTQSRVHSANEWINNKIGGLNNMILLS